MFCKTKRNTEVQQGDEMTVAWIAEKRFFIALCNWKSKVALL